MKKILATGIALLSVVPTTFAQTTAEENLTLDAATAYGRIDNRDNPMNTSLGTTEDQYTKSATGATANANNVNTTTTRPVIDDKIAREMWLRFYCSIVEKGFVWTGDIAQFANPQTCGIAGAGKFTPTPVSVVVNMAQKVEKEVEKKVEEIVSLQTKDSDKVTLTEYKNFLNILKTLVTEDVKKMPENEAALHIMAKLNAALLLSPNISDDIKFIAVKPFEEGFKKDEKVFAELKKFAELEKILKLYDTQKDGEIVIARSPLLVNDIINISLKDGKIATEMLGQNLEIQLVNKNGALVEMEDFEIEYKNLPKGIKAETPHKKGLVIISFTADYEAKQEKFQILVKNKKTGVTISKELTLAPRITEKTDFLHTMTAFEIQEGLK